MPSSIVNNSHLIVRGIILNKCLSFNSDCNYVISRHNSQLFLMKKLKLLNTTAKFVLCSNRIQIKGQFSGVINKICINFYIPNKE